MKWDSCRRDCICGYSILGLYLALAEYNYSQKLNPATLLLEESGIKDEKHDCIVFNKIFYPPGLTSEKTLPEKCPIKMYAC